jgi:cobalt-zinc-cadmium efflux system outer membrane protein
MDDGKRTPLSVPVDSPSEKNEIAFAEELSLGKALARALKYNPSLTAYGWQVRAREAAALQAGLLPNPELSVEAENVLGSGDFSGTEAAETTAALSQLIELGGKRSKRREVAALGTELAEWDYESRRLEVLTETEKSFIAVLAAQRRLEQAEELGSLAENFFTTVSERVKAGKVSPVERSRAQVTLSAARIARAQAEKRLTAARRRLAATWGSSEPAFGRAVGSLGELQPIPPEKELEALLYENPELARWETELAQRKAVADLARAQRIPDLTVSLGARNFRETDDNAAVLGVSIPLPLFDRNQGGIKEAGAELSSALHQRSAIRSEALAELADSYGALSSAYVEAHSLEEEVLPAARQAFESAQIGYEAGKFGFLEVLDAQRTLFEVTQQYTDALADYHQARIEVERLTGAPLAKNIDTNVQESK